MYIDLGRLAYHMAAAFFDLLLLAVLVRLVVWWRDARASDSDSSADDS